MNSSTGTSITMTVLGNWWTRFLFTPVSPTNLALCRILFFGGLLAFYLTRDYSSWAQLPEMIRVPKSLLAHAGVPVFSARTIWWIAAVWKLSSACACVGFRTRFVTLLAAIAGTYVLSIPQDFGKVNHNDQPLVWIMWVFALSRCGDSLSVDRWTRTRVHGKGTLPSSGEYRWPVRMVWLVMATVFCFAGVSKVVSGGLGWLMPGTTQYNLLVANFPIMSFQPWTSWGLAIAQIPWLCSAMAVYTVVVELLFPLALLGSRLRVVFVVGAFLMQVGIRALLGPHFEVYLLAYLFFVPWDKIAHVLVSKTSMRRAVSALAHQSG